MTRYFAISRPAALVPAVCAAWGCLLVGLVIALGPGRAVAQLEGGPLSTAPGLEIADASEVRAALFAWLDEQQIDAATLATAASWWDRAATPRGDDLLGLVAATLALGDPQVAALVEMCRESQRPIPLPPSDWLVDGSLSLPLAANLRLLYGRWLVHQHLYEEAAEMLDKVDPAEVVDPAALLFYQGVSHHRLLNMKEGLAAIERLLSDVADVPQRYRSVAGLMQADLSELEVDTLDHIARRMEDVRRRLDLGRAGPQTIEVEDGVIASLDKLIEELEQQQQQQQQQASSGGSMPNTPAPDSRIMGGSGPGQVVNKDFQEEGGWGDLPPKEREDVLQQIGKEFPAHYRDVIEQYFRRLAGQTDAGDEP